MSYVRAASNLTIDYADADGKLTKHGCGLDWDATEPKEEVFGFTPDVGGQYGWYYIDWDEYDEDEPKTIPPVRFEYIERLKAIAPIRTYTRADMETAAWTLSTRSGNDQWRLSSKSANTPFRLLHMFDTATGLYGSGHTNKATSDSAQLGPNLQFWVMRGPQPVGETDPCVFAIHYRPGAWPDEGIEYAFVFHGQQGETVGTQQTSPLLMAKVAGEDHWGVVTRRQGGASPTTATQGEQSRLEVIRIEYDDGCVLVRTDDRDKGWVFGGKWISYGGVKQTFSLDQSTIEVQVIGHTAMFGMASLTAPTGKVLRPRAYRLVTTDMNNTPAYKTLAATPSGTSIAVAAEELTGNEYAKRPAATFTTSGYARPLLYCIQEYRTATVGSARTSPVSSYGQGTFTVVGLSGHVSPNYRGSTLTATIRSKPGYDLTTLPPNMKLSASIGTADASFNVFTGYTDAPQVTMHPGARDSGTHHAVLEAELNASDYVEARLSHKDMFWHCSYEGWTEGDAFTHILNRAGVPSALISVDAACTNVLPSATMRGARRYKFKPDTKVPQALDAIAAAFARRWGVTSAGLLFLEPGYTHTAGTYDFTIDYLTADPTLIVNSLQSTRTVEDFCNLLYIMAGEGPDAVAKVVQDSGSMWTTTDPNFIGDVWSRFMAYPDAADIDAIATEIWREIGYWQQHVKFSMTDYPTIMPDQNFLLTVPTAVATAGSIFRVLGKEWSVREDGRFEQTIEAVRVE